MALIDVSKTLPKKHICLLAALALATLPLFDGAALAKGKQTTKTRRSGHSYFVPPPPAYSPSILPEMQRQSQSRALVAEESTEKIADNDTADKYVKAKDGYQDPKAVRTNKYVTYWNQK